MAAQSRRLYQMILSQNNIVKTHLVSHRSFCSSTPLIEPVSYAAKPKPQQLEVEKEVEKEEDNVTNNRDWTRDDIRYINRVTSPVSYNAAARGGVAPLPEDRLPEKGNDETEREKSKIEALSNLRVNKGKFNISREENNNSNNNKEKLPFPQLIKQVQNRNKVEKVYFDLQDAIRQVKANAKANFKESFEIHVNLAPELRRTDLKVDGIASLPHGTGKAVKIAVFADGSAAEEARAAGADIVGGLELVDGLKSGKVKVDFDVCITTHQFVPHLQKLGSVLRSRMPSTKAGTVTDNVAKSVEEAKRVVKINKKDKAAVVHAGIGKIDFTEEALRENVGAFVNALLLAKPAGLKKSSKYAGYVNSVHICSTMGRGYPISMQSLSAAADRYNKMRQLT